MAVKHFLGHLLFWVAIMLTYAISEWGYRDNFQQALLYEIIFLPVRMAAVYLNWFLLIPRLLFRGSVLPYLLALLVLLFLLAAGQRYFTLWYAYPRFFPDWNASQHPLIFSKVVQYLVIIASPVAISTGIKAFMSWYEEKARARQLLIEKREAELKYLKAQINPHFLFNTLNNLYGLAIENSRKVPGLLLKLSDFLSYSLYESTARQTSLKQEIQLLKNYVELECGRYDEQRVRVDWDLDEEAGNTNIAPLLFMPLVENAFKHGVREEAGQAQAHIRLSRENGWLSFEVANTLAEAEPEQKKAGIGLANLRRRLQLAYPGAHQLETKQKNGRFTATLKLRIDD